MELNSHKVAQFAPNGFILSNVSHVPEDRNKMGLVGNMTVEENLVLKATEEPRFSYAHGALLKKKAIRKFALELQKKISAVLLLSRKQETYPAAISRRSS